MVGRVAADKDGVGGERRAGRSPRLHGRRRGAIAVAMALTLVPPIGAVGVADDGARAERSMCDTVRAKVCGVAGIAPAACCEAQTRDVRDPDTATTTRALSIAAHAFTHDPRRPAADCSATSLVSVVTLALTVKISCDSDHCADFDAIRAISSPNAHGLHATAVRLLPPS